jgi:hypothetical protein
MSTNGLSHGSQATVTIISTYNYVSKRWVRPKEDSFRAGAFKIYLDGEWVETVVAQGTSTLEVSPGTHTLRIRFRWFMSKRVTFDASPSQALTFVATIPKSMSSFLRLMFRPLSSVALSKS